jgi:O-antigen/teichoic acid export membrane protein
MTDRPVHSAGRLRHAAARGIVSLVARNVAIRLLGLAGNVVLARLLTPGDFGTIALGLTLAAVGSALAAGGVGASLARRPEEPTRTDLRAALAFQLGTTSAFAAVAGPIALAVGGAGTVTALMMLSMPIDALRVATGASAVRSLNFGPIARSEVGEMIAFNLLAILLVAVGLGVWGVAIASIARAVTGTALLIALGPVGWLTPRWDGEVIWRHLRFGAANQATVLVNAGRDQGLNLVVAALGGLAALGVWALASRMLQIVLMVMQALWQVAFPAIARLLEAGESGEALMGRGVRLVAVVVGMASAILGGTAPAAVPVLFGPGWGAIPDLLALGAASLVVSGPITTLGFSFLWAVGAAGRVLGCVIANTVTWLAVAAVLLPIVGSIATGIGMLAAALVARVLVARAIRRHIPLRDLRLTLFPTILAVAAGTASWIVAERVDGDVLALALATLTAVGIFATGALLALADELRALGRLLRGALRPHTPGPAPDAVA